MIPFDLAIAAAGNLEQERIVLTAKREANIANFALFCCLISGDDEVSTGNIPKVFWFEDRKVKSGDLIVLYTKAGKTSEKKNKNKSTSTFYYWGLETPLWTQGRRPVLVATPEWQFGDVIDEEMTTAGRARS